MPARAATWLVVTAALPRSLNSSSAAPTPSADLMAVIGQSERRQDWYRDYALALGTEPLEFVGSAADLDENEFRGFALVDESPLSSSSTPIRR
jgi:hypothetical protein